MTDYMETHQRCAVDDGRGGGGTGLGAGPLAPPLAWKGAAMMMTMVLGGA